MQRSLRVLFVLLLACAVPFAAPAFAQQQISGTVTDAQTGESLPGASVSVPGTTTGTATNIDGEYELTVGAEADSLRFSFVGFESQTVAIAGRTTIDVALNPATQQLEDVVVIGYGSVEERDLTGSVKKVTAAEFNPSSAVSPEQLISGKVSGVQISTPDGTPGGDSFIRIRGATSVRASNRPLFVVDGVPLSPDGAQAQRNPLNFLSRNDIESITVLKDASSTAIYGTRGANGVIIIETKSADAGEARVTYEGSMSAGNTVRDVDVLGVDQFRSTVADRFPQRLALLGDARTDWQEQIQRTAIGQEHNLTVSRGYEDSNIRASLGYLDQEGVLQRSSTKRLSASVNYDQTLLDDDLNIRLSLRGAKTDDEFEPGAMLGSALSFAPTQPIRDFDSPFGGFYEWETGNLAEDNPVAQYILSTNNGNTFQSLGSIEAEYQIPYVDGLSARANVGYDIATGEREAFQPTNLKGQAEQEERAGLVERFSFTQTSQLFDFYLNYNNRFEEISSKFDVTAGYSYQDFDEEYPEFTANGLSRNSFGPNAVPAVNAEFTTTNVNELQNRIISVFGRMNYTFLDRYLLTATVRRDGSSRFGPDRRWGTFPSAAFAWRINQEPILAELDGFSSIVSTLKARFSFGVTGNQEFDDFQFARFYTPGGAQAQAQFGRGDDARFITTIRPSAADEALGWERTRQYTAGLDIGLFDDRYTVTAEFYNSFTDDLLFNVQLPLFIQPSDFVLTNIGELENQGVELAINAGVVETEAFSYNASFTGAFNRNKITRVRGEPGDFELTGGIEGGIGNFVQIIREGDPLNAFYLFEHRRDENGAIVPDDVDTNGDGTVNRLDYYVDRNDDGQITTEDRYIAGDPQPDLVLGHTSNFRYRDFDLSFTLRANLGQQVYNNVASNYGHFARIAPGSPAPSNMHVSVLETGFTAGRYLSDVYLEDASFLRMDNITLGYSTDVIPYVDRVRIYGSVSNAFVLTGYSGLDPEVGGEGSRGIDNNIYPRARTFTTGISVSL